MGVRRRSSMRTGRLGALLAITAGGGVGRGAEHTAAGCFRVVAARLPGGDRLLRAHRADRGALLARRPRLRRREERPHQGLRQPVGHDADRLRRPPDAGPQLLGPWTARPGARLRTSRRTRGSTSCTPSTPPSAAPRRGGDRWAAPRTAARRRPAPTADGCVVAGRLSRLQASGNTMIGSEQVLIEDWCQQYPSHSIGSLAFGADGALYVSGGDGASFNFVDYGQDGAPVNPCGDPPGGVGGIDDAADGRGRGAAEPGPAHDGRPRRPRRRDPAGRPGHRRRAARQPAGVEHRRQRPPHRRLRPAQPVPHHDPSRHQRGLDRRRRLERLGGDQPPRQPRPRHRSTTSAGPATRATAARAATTRRTSPSARTSTPPAPGRSSHRTSATTTTTWWCPTTCARRAARRSRAPRSRSRAAARTRPSTEARCSSPTTPAGASGRSRRAANGLPDISKRRTFVGGAAQPVDLQIGPGGDLFYVDLGGTIRRIRYFNQNQPPIAVATANPTSGAAPLTVAFDGTASSDPDGDALTYAWDLDGDGAFDDAAAATASFTYTQPGTLHRHAPRHRPLRGDRHVVGHDLGGQHAADCGDRHADGGHDLEGRRRDHLLGPRHRRPERHAGGIGAHVVARAAALPVHLPRAPAADLLGHGERQLRRARPRVPVASGAAADGDRPRRPEQHDERPARPADRRPHIRVEPGGADAGGRIDQPADTVHTHRDPRLDALGQRAVTAGESGGPPTSSSAGRTAAPRRTTSWRTRRARTSRPTRCGPGGPVISQVVARPGPGRVTITWTTDVPADSQVQYGPTTTYGSATPLDRTLVTSHSVTITGLARKAQYFFQVLSRDGSREPVVRHRGASARSSGTGRSARDRTHAGRRFRPKASPGGRSRRSLR